MSNVKKFISAQLDIKELSESVEASKVRFSVSLPPSVNRRLEYCSKKLEFSRSGLANVLIEQALSDVEDVLGLKFEEGDQLTEYAKYVFSAAGSDHNDKEAS